MPLVVSLSVPFCTCRTSVRWQLAADIVFADTVRDVVKKARVPPAPKEAASSAATARPSSPSRTASGRLREWRRIRTPGSTYRGGHHQQAGQSDHDPAAQRGLEVPDQVPQARDREDRHGGL